MADIESPQPQEPQTSNTEKRAFEDIMTEPEKTPEQLRAEFFISDLDQKLASENIRVAFTIIMDPKSTQPIIAARGTTYQLARVMVDMARYFKNRLDEELKV